MDNLVMRGVTLFNKKLLAILGDALADIVIHGSAVGGDFVPGKGDVDFIVLLNRGVTDDEYEKITDYHRTARLKNDIESQLEGCYVVWGECIQEGIYIGSTPSRWRRFEGDIFSALDKALIKEVSYSMYAKDFHEKLFDFSWEEVRCEIKQNVESTLELLGKIPDFDFKLHALHSSARSYYTYKHSGFVSKRRALELLELDEDFKAYHGFIGGVKGYKSMLSEGEKVEMGKLELGQIDAIVGKIKERMWKAE